MSVLDRHRSLCPDRGVSPVCKAARYCQTYLSLYLVCDAANGRLRIRLSTCTFKVRACISKFLCECPRASLFRKTAKHGCHLLRHGREKTSHPCTAHLHDVTLRYIIIPVRAVLGSPHSSGAAGMVEALPQVLLVQLVSLHHKVRPTSQCCKPMQTMRTKE